MRNLDNVLNSIYCLSQEAATTIINLRAYPHILKNSDCNRLYILIQELHINTLKAFKDIRLDLLEGDLYVDLGEIFSKVSDIEETYGAFMNSISLPTDHFLVRKLELQIGNIILKLNKLEHILSKVKTSSYKEFMAQ